MMIAKDFYSMIVPEGVLQEVLQGYEADWMADNDFRVESFGSIDVVSAFVETAGVLEFYRKLREVALRVQDLYVDAEMVGMQRLPTTDMWGILCRMEIDYRGEPMDFKSVPLSSYTA